MKRHKWSDIKARAKPETRARIEAEAQRLSDDLHLSQLRKARGLTQETMAELLGVSQAEVSKMERRTELSVGTLRIVPVGKTALERVASSVEVLGGTVDQKGSLVDADKTRFDFTHNNPVTDEQIREIEKRVERDRAADRDRRRSALDPFDDKALALEHDDAATGRAATATGAILRCSDRPRPRRPAPSRRTPGRKRAESRHRAPRGLRPSPGSSCP